MFTKTQAKIMEIFVSRINQKFSINEISNLLNKPYPLIHRSIKILLEQNFLLRDNKKLISLNCKENHGELAYIESVRKREFLEKNNTFSLFFKECLKNIQTDFFIFLVFGSSVEKNGRDIDLLLIFHENELEKNNKVIKNISENFTLKVDINAISIESAYEMLVKREEKNVLNELLNKHVILFGGENFYRILNNARK